MIISQQYAALSWNSHFQTEQGALQGMLQGTLLCLGTLTSKQTEQGALWGPVRGPCLDQPASRHHPHTCSVRCSVLELSLPNRARGPARGPARCPCLDQPASMHHPHTALSVCTSLYVALSWNSHFQTEQGAPAWSNQHPNSALFCKCLSLHCLLA